MFGYTNMAGLTVIVCESCTVWF